MAVLSIFESGVTSTHRDVRIPTRQADRRRYPRHSTLWAGCTVSMIERGETVPLLDLSYGGMFFETRSPAKVGEILTLRVDARRLVAGVANVTARVSRIKEIAPDRFLVGAEFVTSDQAWLGPDVD